MMKFSIPGSPFQKIWQVYEPGFCSEMVSVTFCMNMRPFNCNFGFPSFVTNDLVDILFFGLLMLISLQHRRIISNK